MLWFGLAPPLPELPDVDEPEILPLAHVRPSPTVSHNTQTAITTTTMAVAHWDEMPARAVATPTNNSSEPSSTIEGRAPDDEAPENRTDDTAVRWLPVQ